MLKREMKPPPPSLEVNKVMNIETFGLFKAMHFISSFGILLIFSRMTTVGGGQTSLHTNRMSHATWRGGLRIEKFWVRTPNGSEAFFSALSFTLSISISNSHNRSLEEQTFLTKMDTCVKMSFMFTEWVKKIYTTTSIHLSSFDRGV